VQRWVSIPGKVFDPTPSSALTAEVRDSLRIEARDLARANGASAIIEGGFGSVSHQVGEDSCEEIPECREKIVEADGFTTLPYMFILTFRAQAIRWWSSSCEENRMPSWEGLPAPLPDARG
jgi:hypothetical protein